MLAGGAEFVKGRGGSDAGQIVASAPDRRSGVVDPAGAAVVCRRADMHVRDDVDAAVADSKEALRVDVDHDPDRRRDFYRRTPF
jgi:hypothetical protein